MRTIKRTLGQGTQPPGERPTRDVELVIKQRDKIWGDSALFKLLELMDDDFDVSVLDSRGDGFYAVSFHPSADRVVADELADE